jgi:hypothetical protein
VFKIIEWDACELNRHAITGDTGDFAVHFNFDVAVVQEDLNFARRTFGKSPGTWEIASVET